MSFWTTIFVYFLVWWVMLFTALPIGVTRNQEDGKGYDAGAPAKPDLKKKVIITSILSLIIVALMHLVAYMGWFDWQKTFAEAWQ